MPLSPTRQRLAHSLSTRAPRRFSAADAGQAGTRPSFHSDAATASAPGGTPQSPPESRNPPPPIEERWAAVSVILAPDPDSVLLIRRAERSGDPWSGHIGLPGGRLEAGDADLAATAIRETVEEIGWVLRRESLLGELDDVWPRTPLPQVVVVRPFVFTVDERPVISPSAEVADAFWVPLADLRNPAILQETPLLVRGQRMVFPAYHLPQGVVWGLTERILTPLLSLTA